jgi:hypothetical protein
MNERPLTGHLEQAGENAKSAVREGADALSDAKARMSDTFREVAGTVKEAASGETASADMWRDFVGIVKARPIESLAAVTVLGFFVGRVARRF